MRVAVVTIAKDEEKHIGRWAESAADADLLVVGDTGSADGTAEAAADSGAVVHRIAVRPWRFDVARNALLALVPEDVDVVINVDADEVLVPGWRAELEAAPPATRYSYNYVWSWLADGEPDMQFLADKCHSRFGWTWKHPVHEILSPADGKEVAPVYAGFSIHHFADNGKSRSQYLPLLEVSAKENPADARVAHYLAREYYFAGDWNSSRDAFMRFLAMPSATWAPERAQAYRYLGKMDYEPERWLLRAVAEDPSRRDAMVDLVDMYMQRGMVLEAAGMARRAMRVTRRPGDYMTTAHSYDDGYLQRVIGLVRVSDGETGPNGSGAGAHAPGSVARSLEAEESR